MARAAVESEDRLKSEALLDTARSLETEASELLAALAEHKQKKHPDPAH